MESFPTCERLLLPMIFLCHLITDGKKHAPVLLNHLIHLIHLTRVD